MDEVLSYASARLGREPSLKLVDFLVKKGLFRIIPITLDLFTRAVRVFEENVPVLSFTDAASLVAARTYGIDYIATLDETLARHYPSIYPSG